MIPKILHISAAQLSSGGVERFLLGLDQSLRDDYNFALLSRADTQFSYQMEELGCNVFPWNVNCPLDISAARNLQKTINLFAPDIIHFHDARARLISLLGMGRRLARVVYTVHLPPYYYRWGSFTSIRTFVYGTIERILNTYFTDLVVYPSRRGLEYALQNRYVPEHKAVCIPNGIDLHPFELMGSNHKHQENTIPIICMVARLSPEKNVGFLLEAAALLKKRGCSFQLWVVGDGPERLELEKKAGQLGLAAQTRFLGRLEAVAPILLQSDIFTMTSWYEGGRSQAVMEAQAAGLPCVLSDVGDHASMVDDGRGLLFPEGILQACVDSLEYLLENQQERLLMGANARKYALKVYNLQTMSDQYRQIYQKLLGK
jgi:glycosyltransferase involved in cell wall biosynthesis